MTICLAHFLCTSLKMVTKGNISNQRHLYMYLKEYWNFFTDVILNKSLS